MSVKKTCYRPMVSLVSQPDQSWDDVVKTQPEALPLPLLPRPDALSRGYRAKRALGGECQVLEKAAHHFPVISIYTGRNTHPYTDVCTYLPILLCPWDPTCIHTRVERKVNQQYTHICIGNIIYYFLSEQLQTLTKKTKNPVYGT